MIRFLSAVFLVAVFSGVTWCDENQLDSNAGLFAVLSARIAAGYDTVNSAEAHPLREIARQAILVKKPASLDDLTRFFADHKNPDPTADESQYISFALSSLGPPEFKPRYQPAEVPPDAAKLDGLEGLLARFWKDADLENIWKHSQQAYDQILGAYHGPVTRALFEANAYLRNPTSGYLGRRFLVYVDLAGIPGTTQSRSYKDDYFLVLTPTVHDKKLEQATLDEQTRQVRHAYLHYLLDPLSVKYSANLKKKESLEDIAEGAPALDEVYKRDFLLLATESLIKAVETRLSPGTARSGMVDVAVKEGFVLTPYFAEQLPVYEKQEQSLRLYFPDMVDAIDLRHETKRLDGVGFASKKITPRPEPVPAPQPKLTPGQLALQQGEELSGTHQYAEAKAAFNRVLEQPDGAGLHARAYFAMGRVAAFEKDPELAEKLFEKTLETNPDAETASWANLYLGRLAAAAGENDQAAARYKAAAAVGGGAPKAKAEAEKLLKESAQPQRP